MFTKMKRHFQFTYFFLPLNENALGKHMMIAKNLSRAFKRDKAQQKQYSDTMPANI